MPASIRHVQTQRLIRAAGRHAGVIEMDMGERPLPSFQSAQARRSLATTQASTGRSYAVASSEGARLVVEAQKRS